jgi:pyruvyltransferase
VRPNYGDLLTESILCWLGARGAANVCGTFYRGPALVGAGSILDGLDHPASVVWGSGFIEGRPAGERVYAPAKPLEILALRGPRTAEVASSLGWDPPRLLADPGILVPLMYPRRHSPKYEVGLALHTIHASAYAPPAGGSTGGAGPDAGSTGAAAVALIDLRRPVEEVTRAIADCRVVVSTSLHGAVAAHAFGIPWVWAKMSPGLIGDEFKFHDFMEGMSISASPVYLEQDDLRPDRLLRVAAQAQLPVGARVADRQKELLAALFSSRYLDRWGRGLPTRTGSP